MPCLVQFANDLGDFGVVRMWQEREQVVLDLEVEAPQCPGQHGLWGQKSTVDSTSWTAQTGRLATPAPLR